MVPALSTTWYLLLVQQGTVSRQRSPYLDSAVHLVYPLRYIRLSKVTGRLLPGQLLSKGVRHLLPVPLHAPAVGLIAVKEMHL